MIDHRPVVNTDDLIDEGHARGVDSREVEEFALQYDADVFEVSAKTGEDVDELFFKVAQDFLKSKASGYRWGSQPSVDIRPAPVGQRPIVLGPFPKISDINKKDEHGDTPLHRAARLGNSNRIKRLLDHGANAKITTVRARPHHSPPMHQDHQWRY